MFQAMEMSLTELASSYHDTICQPPMSSSPPDLADLGKLFPVDIKTPLHELHTLDTMQVTRRTYRCSDCGYETNRRNNLKRHINTMHELCEKKLECCGLEFSSKAELRKHIQSKHREGYNCTVCRKNFCRKALLKRHLTVHSGQKEFSCELCGYATSHKSNLERHKKVHIKAFMPPVLDRLETSPTLGIMETESVVSLGSAQGTMKASSSDDEELSDTESDNSRASRDTYRLWKTPYKCSSCGVLLGTQRNLIRHRRIEHYHDEKFLDVLMMPITRRYLLLSRLKHT
ncbi:uncharacterized protein LOC100368392 [Saccoglossus kowalevskii]|uniref:Gastrula zinc finger protein XlCGF57.1-like n=1 Tax=Saccoglossus kowalevskii TaxID=10224 RepID=A0ABM0GZU6_SACKO|nr:PREDICTED: gastrula zinc finger protein XlCGF57.1-like [Saccoglossus kowalevskii]